MKKTDDELLAEARKRFAFCMEAEADDRDKSIADQILENGDQWTDADRVARVGRPCLTINKVSATVDQITGDARRNRPSIKVRPAGGAASKMVADILTGLVRNIENESDAETIYDYAIACAARGGWGAWRIVTEFIPGTMEQTIRIKRIVDPHSVWLDPNSTDLDNRDARYGFITDEITKAEFESLYPDEAFSSWDSDVKQDWILGDNIRIAEYFYKTEVTETIHQLADGTVVKDKDVKIISDESGKYIVGKDGMLMMITKSREEISDKVNWCKFSGAALLKKGEWGGKYIPIVICLGREVWVNGKRERRSSIRFAHDSQYLYNWARSNSVETMMLSPKQPFVLTADEIEGHELQWQQANSTPQPYLLYNKVDGIPGRPARQPGSFPDAGAIQEAMLASDDIKATTGTYNAAVGDRSNETSGKAIHERKSETDTSTFEFHDNQAKAIRQTGRIIVDLIPKYIDTEQIVRILGEDGKEAMITVNQEIQSPGDNENPVLYDLRVGRYDVVVDAGPGYATKRLEATDGMLQTLEYFPQGAPVLVPMIAKNSDWPDSDKVAEKLEAIAGGGQPGQPPGQQQGPPPPDPRQILDMEKGKLDLESKQLSNEQKKQALMKGTKDDEYKIKEIILDTLQQVGLLQ